MIREIEQYELEKLLKLYEHLHDNDLPPPSRTEIDRIWESITKDKKVKYFILEEDGLFISSCHLVIVPNLTRSAKPYGWIENVVTHKDHRNKGYGKLILQHALTFAWKEGCYKVMLMTGRKDDKVYNFYASAGFDAESKKAFIAKPPKG